MIDALVKLAEKLVALLQYREEMRARRFARVVEPIYASMLEVHQDYLDVLSSVRRDIESRKSPQETAKYLAHASLRREPLRISIVKKIGALLEAELGEEMTAFLTAVRVYFNSAGLSGGGTPLTTVNEKIARWIEEDTRATLQLDEIETRELRDMMRRTVDVTLERVRTRWQVVAQGYAELLRSSL